MSDNVWRLPLETEEWVGPLEAFVTTSSGELIQEDWSLAVVELGFRPTEFVEPDILDGLKGVFIGPETRFVLPISTYGVWVKILGESEKVVIENVVYISIV